MAKDLEPTNKQFLTYNTKDDPSNSDPRFLTYPSKNVLISNIEKVVSRPGFVLQSPVANGGSSIPSSTEWGNSTGDDFALEAHNAIDGNTTTGILKVLINGAWETLMDSLISIALIFDPYWDDTEKIDRLAWCDGTTNIYDWSGATANLGSITAATITLQGTDTFGQHRFILNGTRAIRIKDDNGIWHRTGYTGGESTTTLTGLTVDLTAFPFSGSNLIIQEVIIHPNIIDSVYTVDFLKVIENQLWLGSRTSNKIYFSKNTSVTDYSFSTPRAVGEGGQLTLDGPGRAIESLKGDVILFAGKSYIYKSVFNQITVGLSLAETVKVERLKTTSRQSALHQNLVTNIGNGLIWIGCDNVLYELTDATLAYNPELRPISDPVKPTFDATDFTGGHLKFDKTRVYISAPASTINYIYEYRLNIQLLKEWFWQPPQTMPVSRWAIIDDVIHGHSSAQNETYKLFYGTNDNGQAIHSIAKTARWNGGIRTSLKNVDEMFNEGAITPNTSITCTYQFDIDGGDISLITKTINGNYEDILFPMAQDPSLGNNPFGDVSLSGDVDESDSIRHFRCIDDINIEEFFDYSVQLETNDLDYRWEWMVHGSNSTLSTGKPTAIKNNI